MKRQVGRSFVRFGAYALAFLSTACSAKFNYDGSALNKANLASSCEETNCLDTAVPLPNLTSQRVEVENSRRKVDVLVVADNSGSMDEERAKFASRLADFTDKLSDVDWNLCVTTTDISREKGQLVRFGTTDRYALNRDVPNFENLFVSTLTSLPSGSGDEQGIYATNLAISKNDPRCFRQGAALAVVVMSDEDERSTGGWSQYRSSSQFRELTDLNMPESVPRTVASVFGPEKVFSFHSLVIRSNDQACFNSQSADHLAFYGTRYEELSRLTEGVIGNICADDYGSELGQFARGIQNSLATVVLKCQPVDGSVSVELSSMPADFGAVSHIVEGDRIRFAPALPAGAVADLTYECP